MYRQPHSWGSSGQGSSGARSQGLSSGGGQGTGGSRSQGSGGPGGQGSRGSGRGEGTIPPPDGRGQRVVRGQRITRTREGAIFGTFNWGIIGQEEEISDGELERLTDPGVELLQVYSWGDRDEGSSSAGGQDMALAEGGVSSEWGEGYEVTVLPGGAVYTVSNWGPSVQGSSSFGRQHATRWEGLGVFAVMNWPSGGDGGETSAGEGDQDTEPEGATGESRNSRGQYYTNLNRFTSGTIVLRNNGEGYWAIRPGGEATSTRVRLWSTPPGLASASGSLIPTEPPGQFPIPQAGQELPPIEYELFYNPNPPPTAPGDHRDPNPNGRPVLTWRTRGGGWEYMVMYEDMTDFIETIGSRVMGALEDGTVVTLRDMTPPERMNQIWLAYRDIRERIGLDFD